ncbi:unnamed protein product [Medioppia subpectinata]|uniref:DJ-1/PfpI domain-containing protein n=1 Tax=Medioppia subpectinata TaxID=1979941 RepID=A0A7R9KMJ0_9ACAR|nr:unnamed protein product [Medioppia subpectinata]CAG2106271.1 unnamed protein product [Medioppia subpectinata]
MAPKALIVLAPGSEEMEVVIAAAVLVRAGVSVTVAGLEGQVVHKCRVHVMIAPDVSLESVKDQAFDALILPGGLTGSERLVASPLVGHILRRHEVSGALIAAICAAPTALKAHGVGLKKRITSHPFVADQLREHYSYSEDRVVIDGQLITSRAPGTAFEWALAIVENLVGKEKVEEIRPPLFL